MLENQTLDNNMKIFKVDSEKGNVHFGGLPTHDNRVHDVQQTECANMYNY